MPTTVTFDVPDLSCGNCVKHVGEALNAHAPGATHAVDLAAKQVTVTFDEGTTSVAGLAAALDDAGYPATAA